MAKATADGPSKKKQCDICHRKFARTEHLLRHRRTHTSEKPFKCPFCDQTFPREDVRTAHIKKSHPSILAHTSLENVIGTRSVRAKACEQCRSRKVRCAGGDPCDVCQRSNRTCTWSSPPSSSAQSRSHVTPQGDSAEASSQGVSSHQTSGSADLASHIMEMEVLTGSESFSIPANENPLRIPNDVDMISVEPLNWNIFDTGYNDWNGDFNFLTIPARTEAEPFPGSDTYPFIDWGALLANETLDELDQSATAMMKDYLGRRQSPGRSSPSTQAREQAWYSAPPQLQIYDDEVIEALLKIFRHQFSKTFPIFAETKTAPESTVEMCLFMAAVGALFCDVGGSFKVAKALYNDARRMLLAYKVNQSSSFYGSLHILKCFILLEIYGLCCGEQRAFEFVEAFHQELLQAYHNYCTLVDSTLASPAARIERQQLDQSIYTLECYRVIILQRPPNTYPLKTPEQRSSLSDHTSSDPELTKLVSILCTFGKRIDDTLLRRHSLPALTILSLYSWGVTPRNNSTANPASLWNVEFVQLALNNWFYGQDGTTDWLTMVLYHMINANLHLNLGLLQQCVHGYTLAKHDSLLTSKLESLAKSEGFEIALSHVRSLLEIVREQQARCQQTKNMSSMTSPSGSRSSIRSTGNTDHGPVLQEAPHLPYAIYFSSLIEWTASVGQKASSASCASAIELGIRLLSNLRIQVAEVLIKLLQELTK